MEKAKTPGEAPERKQYATNDRTFVRGIQGEYNLTQELERLRAKPRVIRGRDLEYFNGPHVFGKHYLEPKNGLGQTLHVHLQEYAPGATSQKHGHVNEAVFYILDGIGAEVHDGIKYDWEAGDVVIVMGTGGIGMNAVQGAAHAGRLHRTWPGSFNRPHLTLI